MGLSCSTDIDGDYSWWYIPEQELAPLATKRWRKCSSCSTLMRVGTPARKFNRWRSPNNEIEERIHGDEVHQAPLFMCETCSDLYDSLNELGYCCDIEQDLKTQIAEYKFYNGHL